VTDIRAARILQSLTNTDREGRIYLTIPGKPVRRFRRELLPELNAYRDSVLGDFSFTIDMHNNPDVKYD
jgi:hypothetical protein